MFGQIQSRIGAVSRQPIQLSFLLTLLLIAVAHPVRAAELQPDTLKAWNAYVNNADLQVQARAQGRKAFLWADESRDRASRVQHGEVVVEPMVGHGTEVVPSGLIHHWIGTVFIPGATRDSFWAVVRDYDNYQRMYRPAVTSSRTLACTEGSREFQMVWQRKVLFVNAAIEGRYQAHDVVLDRNRGYSLAEAVEIREIEGYGHTGERLLPPNTGNGFIWRIRSVARYEERDGGVYLEIEAMALTRDIPASVAWLVKPVINRLSMNSLATTLRQTRDAVIASHHDFQSLAACPLSYHAPSAGGE